MDIRTHSWFADELCAKSPTLMVENVIEETGEELPHVTNKIKLYPLFPCFSFLPSGVGWNDRNDNQRANIRLVLRCGLGFI